MNESKQNLKKNILSELPDGNQELGEAFALILNNMVVQNGITNPKGEDFEVVPPSWRKLAQKPDKTEDEIKKLDSILYEELNALAQSYLLFIAKETKNTTGEITYPEYETFMLKYRFGNYSMMNYTKYLNEVKEQIKVSFDKICTHCLDVENKGYINKFDMAVFLYALLTKSDRDENKNFKGFKIDGVITPFDYAVSEALLFENKENLFTIKLKVAHEVLKKVWE